MNQKSNRVIFFCTLSVVIILLCIVGFTFYEIHSYRENYITANEQDELEHLETMALFLKNDLAQEIEGGASLESAQDTAISKYFEPKASGKNNFYVFATDDDLLFYQNDQLTQNRFGYTLTDLLEQYESNGGKYISDLKEELQTKNQGCVRFSVSKEADQSSAIFTKFKIGQKQYYLLFSMNTERLIQSSKLKLHIWSMYVIVLLLSLILIVVTFYSGGRIKTLLEKKRSLTKELKQRNMMIAQLNYKLNPSDESTWSERAIDEELGIYTEAFADIFLSKLSTQKEVMAQIAILGGHLKKGTASGWKDILPVINQQIGESDYLFLVNNNKLMLIGFGDSKTSFNNKLISICKNCETVFANQSLKLDYSMCTFFNNQNIYALLQPCFEEINKKMKH